ncbi:MAG: TetR/AcrR family transcriptional regulator [Candidatus Hodarchaeales archaeon]|jgi:AcrR family transcriptional regulator
MNNNTKTDSPKKKRRARERQFRKNAIIQEAEKTFLARGYDEAKIETIAKISGYTKTTLYKYFDSKDDLFTAVLALIYLDMHSSMSAFIKSKDTPQDLRLLGNAFLHFMESYPGKTQLINSGRCMTISQRIIDKERLEQQLTESENEYKQNELQLGLLLGEVLLPLLEESPIMDNVDPSRIVFILAALNLVIREMIRRGKVLGQSYEYIKENLTVLFTIIEQGVKNYVEN